MKLVFIDSDFILGKKRELDTAEVSSISAVNQLFALMQVSPSVEKKLIF